MTKHDGTEIEVAELPTCDFCTAHAQYDAKTIFGPWANLCQRHFDLHAASLQLGVGRGQRLIQVQKGTAA